jgi:hypothetical protein
MKVNREFNMENETSPLPNQQPVPTPANNNNNVSRNPFRKLKEQNQFKTPPQSTAATAKYHFFDRNKQISYSKNPFRPRQQEQKQHQSETYQRKIVYPHVLQSQPQHHQVQQIVYRQEQVPMSLPSHKIK